MKSKKIDPKFNKIQNPKIGLIVLASDYMIEKDFIKIIKDMCKFISHLIMSQFL